MGPESGAGLPGIPCAILPELDEFEDASAEEGERSGAHAAQRVAALEQLSRIYLDILRTLLP